LTRTGPEAERANSFVGTAEYVSPELLTSKMAFKSSDWWAFGCVIYQMLRGRPPFKAPSEYLTFQKIVKLDYNFPPQFPNDAKDLVQKLLVLEPSARPEVEEIKSHPFFQPINWATLWSVDPPPLTTGLFAPPPRPAALNLDEFDGDDGIDDHLGFNPETPRVASTPGIPDGDHTAISPATASIYTNPNLLPNSNPTSSKWSNALKPGELIIFSSPVVDRTTTGGGLLAAVGQGRRRHLVLTDGRPPRLLCLREGKSRVKVKIEITLGEADGPDDLISVEEEGPKTFKVVTSSKVYRFEEPGGSVGRWVSVIRETNDAHSRPPDEG